VYDIEKIVMVKTFQDLLLGCSLFFARRSRAPACSWGFSQIKKQLTNFYSETTIESILQDMDGHEDLIRL
jgi:hypothetical protein